MGLDQSWLVVDEDGERTVIHEHRKVPALEAFMAAKWHESRKQKVVVAANFLELGDTAPELAENDDDNAVFNCEELQITHEILDELQVRVTERTLDSNASGFFWGRHYDEDYEDIQNAINSARPLIGDGLEVVYTSWW